MKFKVKNILLVSFLAIAGFFGVSSTLINKQVNEQPVAEKAEAYTGTSTTRTHTIWLNYTNVKNSWSGFDPHIAYQADTWHEFETGTDVSSGVRIFEVPANTSKIVFTHTGWYENNCQTEDLGVIYDSPATNGACVENYFTMGNRPSDSGTKIPGSWSYNTGLTNTFVFNKNHKDATGTVSNQQIWLNNATLKSDSFTRTGYSIDYWTTNENGTGTKYYAGTSYTYSNFPSMVEGDDINLYAHWVGKTSALTFNLNGATSGTAPTGKTATYGSAMPTYGNTAPTKTGYTFSGFYDSSDKQYYTSALASTRNWDKDTTSGTTLTAKWTAKTSALTFNLNGGSGTAATGLTATYGSAMPAYSQSAPTKTNYRFDGFYDSSNKQYYTSALASACNWDKNTTSGTTLYAKWVQTVVITYSFYDVNGNTITGTGTTSPVTKDYNTAYSLPTPSKSGYYFENWYTAYNSTTHAFSGDVYAGGASYTPTSTTTLYAKFIPVGAYLTGGHNGWVINSTSLMGSSGSSGYVVGTCSFADIEGTEGQLKVCHVTESSMTYYGWSHKQSYGDASSKFEDGGGWTSDNNIACTVADVFFDVIFNTSTHSINFYYSDFPTETGYYAAGTGSFAANGNQNEWSFDGAIKMDSTSAAVKTNTAILENGTTGYAVTDGSTFKVAQFSSLEGNTWYSLTLGETYTGIAHTNDNAVVFDRDGNFNIYFKATSSSAGTIWLVDADTLSQKGYWYFPSNAAASSITITTKVSGGTKVLDGVKLNTVGVSEISMLAAWVDSSNYTHLYKVPILNLRGDSVSSVVTTVEINDGSSLTVTGIPDSASTPHLYARNGAVNVNKGLAAKAVFEIAAAIDATTHDSVCELTQTKATELKGYYDAAASYGVGGHTLTTWTSKDRSATTSWTLAQIYPQISAIASTGKPIGQAVRSFSPISLFADDEGGLSTIIIIAASSVALLSVTALSVLVIKKRKNKEE